MKYKVEEKRGKRRIKKETKRKRGKGKARKYVCIQTMM